MSDFIPVFKKGDRVRIMATIWAMEQGIENEKGTIHDKSATSDSYIVHIDRENSYRNIPTNKLMRIE